MTAKTVDNQAQTSYTKGLSPPVILAIGGSDSSGGAGIEADIKAITMHKCYAATAITCITSQNTSGVAMIKSQDPGFILSQIEMICEELNVSCVKTGMLYCKDIILALISSFKPGEKLHNVPLVLDPVCVATSGAKLLKPDAIDALRELGKFATVITPNINEVEELTQISIKSTEDMRLAAGALLKQLKCKSVVVKGGDLKGTNVSHLNDGLKGGYSSCAERSDTISNVLLFDAKFYTTSNPRVKKWTIANSKLRCAEQTNSHTEFHGTGCSFAASLACNIALGKPLPEAFKKSSSYVYKLLKSSSMQGISSALIVHALVKPQP